MSALERLESHVAAYGSALIAHSGGVDSSLVAVVARRSLGRPHTLAVLAHSASLPAELATRADALARRFDIPFLVAETDELEDPRYRANAPDRCFHCKSALWARLVPLARARALAVVLDGTNADDLRPGEHRPGNRAGQAAGVQSPLAELGVGKKEVRQMAQALGLPNWNAPAAPCLASRVRIGLPVTAGRLAQIERAEAIVRAVGVRGDLRVRHLGSSARVEVDPRELPVVQAVWPELAPQIRELGFAAVELDPRGYRRGALIFETVEQCGSSSP
jgi:uncharacterized protein